MYEIQVWHHTDRIAGDGCQRRAVNVDLRDGDQRIVQENFDAYACQQGGHGHPLFFQPLQNAAGCLHYGKQHNGHGAQAEHMGRLFQIGLRSKLKHQAEQPLTEHGHGHGAGHAHHKSQPQPQCALTAHIIAVAPGDGCRNRGHQAHGNGGGYGGRHVNQRQHIAGIASVKRRCFIRFNTGLNQSSQQKSAVNEARNRHDTRADRNGNAESYQPPERTFHAVDRQFLILRKLPEFPAVPQIDANHVQKRQRFRNRGTQQNARHGIGDRNLTSEICQRKGDEYLGHLLDKL